MSGLQREKRLEFLDLFNQCVVNSSELSQLLKKRTIHLAGMYYDLTEKSEESQKPLLDECCNLMQLIAEFKVQLNNLGVSETRV